MRPCLRACTGLVMAYQCTSPETGRSGFPAKPGRFFRGPQGADCNCVRGILSRFRVSIRALSTGYGWFNPALKQRQKNPQSDGQRPQEASFHAGFRSQDQAVPGLQVAIPERMGRRAHLPTVQVERGLAERSGQQNALMLPPEPAPTPHLACLRSPESFILSLGTIVLNP